MKQNCLLLSEQGSLATSGHLGLIHLYSFSWKPAMKHAQPVPMDLSAPRARHPCLWRTGSVWLRVGRDTFRISFSAQVTQSKKKTRETADKSSAQAIRYTLSWGICCWHRC